MKPTRSKPKETKLSPQINQAKKNVPKSNKNLITKTTKKSQNFDLISYSNSKFLKQYLTFIKSNYCR